MSEMILSIAAEADITSGLQIGTIVGRRQGAANRPLAESLAAHQFPASRDRGEASRDQNNSPAESTTASQPGDDFSAEEERRRRIYRNRTVGMLRRYMRYSIETGRLPSLVGREFFRSKVTKYRVVTFEDRVIFVHDMETCLHRLDDFSQQVLARTVLQEYGHEDAARLLGCTRMTVHRFIVY